MTNTRSTRKVKVVVPKKDPTKKPVPNKKKTISQKNAEKALKKVRTARKTTKRVASGSADAILARKEEFDDFDDKINSELGCKLSEVTANSPKHNKRCLSLLNTFTRYLYSYAKWVDMMKPVLFFGQQIPMLFRACSVEYQESSFDTKAKLANDAFTDFFAQMMKEDGSFYQPSTQSMMMRTLVSYMSQRYDWNFSIERDFKFESGGLGEVMTKLYQERKKKDKDGNYGGGKNRKILSDSEAAKIKEALRPAPYGKFNEDIPEEHQIKVLFEMGYECALRGKEEHALMMIENIKK